MKRYWKISFLSFLSFFVIGAFYIQSSFAGQQQQLQIEFEKIKGNEKEVKNLLLYGDYESGHLYQGLQITSEETIHQNRKSLLQELSTNRYAPVIRNLIEQHKGFMRGKGYSPNTFYEDETLIVYGNIKGDFNDPMANSTFDIEVLNKKSDKTTSIEIDVPDRETYSWITVEDVQVVKDALKLVTREFKKEGGEEVRVYTFDMKTEKLTAAETIVTTQTSENGWTEISMNQDYHQSTEPQNYYLIKTKSYEAENVQKYGNSMSYEGGQTLTASEAFIYNLKKNQLEKLVLPEELDLQQADQYWLDHSTLYVQTRADNVAEIETFNIEKAAWGEKRIFALPQVKDSSYYHMIELMNGKLYVISSGTNENSLFIWDLKTGETLYEGKLKVTNQDKDPQDYRLNFHDIEIL